MKKADRSKQAHGQARVVACAQCGCLSGLRWAGWRANRIDEPEFDEPPALAFFCPACAEAEFSAGSDGG